jgi:NAD(P)-dependent dehydrogenase (short-subunit alcohol dehydrogenase family)
MRDLEGKAAFVTGAASGIGLALATALAEAGCRVMLADIEEPAIGEAVENLQCIGPDIRGVVCDVADPASLREAAARTVAAFGNIHVLCNNAGVGGGSGSGNISLDTWRWVLDVNVMGVVNGLHAFLPHMRSHGEAGHILNTASMAGLLSDGALGFSAYTASKYAVVAISEGLRAELAPEGIGVTVLCPGFVRTRIAEAERNRPARYGAPVDSPLREAVAEAVRGGIEPAAVARRAVAAMHDDEPYVFTHAGLRPAVAARFERILSAFDGLDAQQ